MVAAGMESTEPKTLLCGKLLEAQRNLADLPKDSENSFHRYRYTSADTIIRESRRVLNLAGLVVRRVEHKTIDFPIDGWLAVESQFAVEDPESKESILAISAYPYKADKGMDWDKSLSAALTTSFAYWLRDLLAIDRSDAEVDRRGDENKPAPRSEKPPTRKRGPPRTADPLRDSNLDKAFAALVDCVKLFVPDDNREPWEIKEEAVAHLAKTGDVTDQRIRKLADAVAAKHSPADEVDQDRQVVLDQIASSKWAAAAFEPLRASAEFADGNAVAFLKAKGIDLSTKEGRQNSANYLKAGIDWTIQWAD